MLAARDAGLGALAMGNDDPEADAEEERKRDVAKESERGGGRIVRARHVDESRIARVSCRRRRS